MSNIEERNLSTQFEAEQQAMSAHLLGHGTCPACQEEGVRLIQENHRLRTVNAQLLKALEKLTAALTQPKGGRENAIQEAWEQGIAAIKLTKEVNNG